MKKDFFINRIFFSFGSKDLYQKILREHFLFSLLYLALISFIFSIPPTIHYSISMQRTVNFISFIVNDPNCPDFELDGADLLIKSTEVRSFVDDDHGYKVIFDPGETASYNELAGYEIGVLITTKKAVIYGKELVPNVIPYTTIAPFSAFYHNFNRDFIRDTMNHDANTGVIVWSLILTFSFMIYGFFLSLVASLISLFTKSLVGIPINFVQNYKISIYVMSFPLIVMGLLYLVSERIAANFGFGIFIVLFGFLSGSLLTSLFKGARKS